jgi:transposase
MLQLTPHTRIFLAVEAIDGRKGIDGLAAVCRHALGDNPLDGAVYVFRTRAGRTLKLLAYDGQGFWLCTKRLSHGRFRWWPTTTTPSVRLSAPELSVLLWNGFPDRAQMAPEWRPIAYEGTRGAG